MLHDVKTGTLVLDTQALLKPTPAYAAAARAPRIAVGRASGELELFDLPAGFRRVLPLSEEPVIAVRLSEDGGLVAACGLDERVHLFDARTGRLVYEMPHPAMPFLVAMGGDLLVTRADDQTTRFFDLATGAPRTVLQGNAEPEDVTRRKYWEVLGEGPVAFHRKLDPVPMAHFHLLGGDRHPARRARRGPGTHPPGLLVRVEAPRGLGRSLSPGVDGHVALQRAKRANRCFSHFCHTAPLSP